MQKFGVSLILSLALSTPAEAKSTWYLQMLGGGFNSKVAFAFPTRTKCEGMKRSLIRNITSVKPKPTGRCTWMQPKSTNTVLQMR